MRGASDESLMRQYGSGDMAAFETLYQRYRGPLYRYFLRHLGDTAATNDLYQGCWEKVIGARKRYRASAPFKAWLFRIAHNHLVDHYRAQRPQDPLVEKTAADMADDDPAEAATATERRERLLAAVAKLPAEQREVLLLRLEGGLDLDEIGKITGAGFETAKSRLRYATRKLKQVLQT